MSQVAENFSVRQLCAGLWGFAPEDCKGGWQKNVMQWLKNADGNSRKRGRNQNIWEVLEELHKEGYGREAEGAGARGSQRTGQQGGGAERGNSSSAARIQFPHATELGTHSTAAGRFSCARA